MTVSATRNEELMKKILERHYSLPPDVVNGMLIRARNRQQWLGQVVVEDGILTYAEIARSIAGDLKLPQCVLREVAPDFRALEMVPEEFCRKHSVVPLGMNSDYFTVAIANPLDDEVKRAVSDLVGASVTLHVAPLDEIQTTITDWYAQAAQHTEPGASVGFASFTGTEQFAGISGGGGTRHTDEIAIEDLLLMMVENRASDLHLAVGSPPLMRVDGELQPMPFPVMRPNVVQPLVYSILTDVQITTYERHWELDFSYSLPGVSRFRVNIHRQRGSLGAVFRMIPSETPSLDKLHMPPIIREFTERPRGLVLVTGPTGSGKSTTLAAMVDEINRTRRTHIVTIEDPIEFLHNNKMSVITQREVGSDTESFTIALRHVLRQDPDVILIGEMRDLETVSAALTAAETGHLVFATLHTTSAAQTIDRIVDVFPEHQQDQVRTQLANVLEGIVTQTLLQHINGTGRCCAQEIMIGTPAIRTLIRDNKVHQMPGVIQASGKYSMQTLDQALRQLVLNKQVTLEEAITKASNADDFKALLAMQ